MNETFYTHLRLHRERFEKYDKWRARTYKLLLTKIAPKLQDLNINRSSHIITLSNVLKSMAETHKVSANHYISHPDALNNFMASVIIQQILVGELCKDILLD